MTHQHPEDLMLSERMRDDEVWVVPDCASTKLKKGQVDPSEVTMTPEQLLGFAAEFSATRTIVSRNDVLFGAIRKHYPEGKAWTGPGRKYRDTHSWDKILITKFFNSMLDEQGNKVWRRDGNQSSTRFIRITRENTLIQTQGIGVLVDEYMATKTQAKRDDILFHLLEKQGLESLWRSRKTECTRTLRHARLLITLHMEKRQAEWLKIGNHKATRWERVAA